MAVPPPTTPVVRSRVGWATLAIRLVLTLLGAAALVVSAFLEWIRDIEGVNLDIEAFWQRRFGRDTDVFLATVGFAMIVLGLLAIIGLAPRTGLLTRLAGVLGIAGFVLFVIEVYRSDGDIRDVQVGAWVALAGSVLALAAGFFYPRTEITAAPGPPADTVVEP